MESKSTPSKRRARRGPTHTRPLTAAYLCGPAALRVPWQPRPAPPRPAAGAGGAEPLLRGGERERERVLSAHVTRRARSPLPLLAALPCPPSAGAQRRPRSRERVSGPTGCWRSGGGGGGAGGGAGSAAGPGAEEGEEGSGSGAERSAALLAWSGKRRGRAGAALSRAPLREG